ncbi:MAG: hypothetical protein ACHQJ5_05135 [Vicinamibacteria bacterium]|jgi:hypothetical protein
MAKRKQPAAAESEASELYALPLGEFTAARDEAAKRLRASGDADAARAVKALRKPSRAAWAINQAVRAEPGATRELIEAGERLARAQDGALAGEAGGGAELRAAIAAQGEEVERLTEAALRQLGAGGEPHLDRVRETLRAVAGDDRVRSELETGTLIRDHEASGFGANAAAAAPRARAKAAGAGRADEARRRRQLENAVKKARHSFELATKRLGEAERRRERAERGLAEAEQGLETADRERRESEAELERAESDLAGL